MFFVIVIFVNPKEKQMNRVTFLMKNPLTQARTT